MTLVKDQEPDRDAADLQALAAEIAKDWNGRIVTGDGIRRAIARATPLTDPRLSEVEWDEVAAALRAPGAASPDRVLPDWRKPPRYQWTDKGMVLDSKGSYVLAHMVPALYGAASPEPLPDGACGVMGLCELPKGHEGQHSTSVDRAIGAASPEPVDVERLARALAAVVSNPSSLRRLRPSPDAFATTARLVAAEYARLSGDPSEERTDG